MKIRVIILMAMVSFEVAHAAAPSTLVDSAGCVTLAALCYGWWENGGRQCFFVAQHRSDTFVLDKEGWVVSKAEKPSRAALRAKADALRRPQWTERLENAREHLASMQDQQWDNVQQCVAYQQAVARQNCRQAYKPRVLGKDSVVKKLPHR